MKQGLVTASYFCSIFQKQSDILFAVYDHSVDKRCLQSLREGFNLFRVILEGTEHKSARGTLCPDSHDAQEVPLRLELVLHGAEGGDILQQPRRLLSDQHRAQRRANLHPLHALGLWFHLMEGRTVHIQHPAQEHRQLNPRIDKGNVNRRKPFRQDPGVAPLVVYLMEDYVVSSSSTGTGIDKQENIPYSRSINALA